MRDADAELDRLFAPLARAVAASVRRHAGEGPVSPLTRALVLRDLDERILPPVFGRRPNDPDSPLLRLVVRHCLRARLAAVQRSVEFALARLPADLRRIVESSSQ